MRLSFVLPVLADHPVGGYKVHYQYANELASRGHFVTLVHAVTVAARPSLRQRAVLARARTRQALTSRPAISWFSFESGIVSIVVPSLTGNSLPEADVTILTAWQTAERTVNPTPSTGVFAQIVYDYEFWMSNPPIRPRISAALARSDVFPIATSSVVTSMLREIGREPVAQIPAGLLEGEFGVDTPIGDRPRVVTFPRRSGSIKGLPTALEAVKIVHEAVPDARFECFGVDKTQPLPDWVTNLGNVSQTDLRAAYNRAGIFMLPSRYEGWGLPAAEAMACGAAVVATRCGGVEDFLVDDANGLLVPKDDPLALAHAVIELLTDEPRRSRLANQGSHDARLMSVARSTSQLEAVLSSLVEC